MSKYELMYIIDAGLEEAPRKELVDRISTLITTNGGALEKVDEWGKRRLAYPINYKNEGYYVLVHFSAPSDLPHEVERVLGISEDVLRHLIIRLEQKHTSVKPRPVPIRPAFARPAAPEAEAGEAAGKADAQETPPARETAQAPAAEEPSTAQKPAAEPEA